MRQAATLAILGLALSAPAAAAADSYVYAANLGGSSLSQFGLGPGGALSPKSPPSVPAQRFVSAATVSPDGRSVYFADELNGYLFLYDVAANGQLTPKPGAPQLFPSGAGEALGLAMSPSGGTLYVAGANNFAPDEVLWFDVAPGTGLLSPKGSLPLGRNVGPSAVAISPNGQNAYVTNVLADTVAQFTVGADGALTPMNPPTIGTGDSPRSVVVSPNGTSLYVGNFRSQSISQYDIGAGGALAPKDPATVDAAGGPNQIVITSDGLTLFSGEGQPGLTTYSVGAGGGLTIEGTADAGGGITGAGAVGVALSPDDVSVYTTDEDVYQGHVFQFDAVPGAAAVQREAIDVGTRPLPVAVSTDGRSVWVGGSGDGLIWQFDRQLESFNALSPPTAAGSFQPTGVAVTPDGKSVYAVAPAGVFQFDLGLGGLLTPTEKVDAGAQPRSVAVSVTGRFAYVTNQADGTVSQYDVLTGNSLAPRRIPTVATGNRPWSVATGERGVYVVNRADDTLSQYTDEGDSLVPQDPPTVGTGRAPFGVAVSPDGLALYVTNTGAGTVSQYKVLGDGKLTPNSPATAAAGVNPLGIAVHPLGSTVYVANQGSDSISLFRVRPLGELEPMNPATVPAGDEPSGLAVSPSGHSLFVAGTDDGMVRAFDILGDGSLVRKQPFSVAAGVNPFALAASPEIPAKVGRPIRLARRGVRVNRRGVAAVRVRCPTRLDRCRIRVALRRVGWKRVIGRDRIVLRGARSGSARVKLSRRALAALRSRGRLRVRVTARSLHAAGNRSRRAATIILRAPR